MTLEEAVIQLIEVVKWLVIIGCSVAVLGFIIMVVFQWMAYKSGSGSDGDRNA